MAVHKTSEQAQLTNQDGDAVSLKMAPLLSDGLFEDNGSDIGRQALQLLLELDVMSSGTDEASKLDDISGHGGIRAKLLNLFVHQNMVKYDGSEPKITATGRRSFHTVLSCQTLGQQMLANPAAIPRGRDATSMLLAILRNHFFEDSYHLKAGI